MLEFGEKLDFIEGVDNIAVRNVLDRETNKHSDSFIEFLLGTKMCIINGRVQGKMITHM